MKFFSAKRILLVEDDSDTANAIEELLTDEGYDVCGVASTGKGAIDEAKRLGPDAILMDVHLGDAISGVEAAEEIVRSRNIPIVFLTGDVEDQTIQRAKKIAAGFLVKPFNSHVLKPAIEIAVYRHLANAAQRLRSDVVAVVAHDLRRPLTSILLHTQLVKRQPQTELVTRSVAAIETCALQLNRMVVDLIDMEAIEKGTFELKTETCLAAGLLTEPCAVFEPLTQERGVLFSVDSKFSNETVLCDRARIGQVWLILLGNAVKLAPRGSRITIGGSVVNNLAEFFVRDESGGLPEEYLPNLFKRLETWQPRKKSWSLGLYIASNILRAHQGDIWASSRKGVGSEFRFALPLSSAQV